MDATGPDTNGNIIAVTPGRSSPQPLFISGTPGGSGMTGFQVDKVEYTVAQTIPAMTEGGMLLMMVLLGVSGLALLLKRGRAHF